MIEVSVDRSMLAPSIAEFIAAVGEAFHVPIATPTIDPEQSRPIRICRTLADYEPELEPFRAKIEAIAVEHEVPIGALEVCVLNSGDEPTDD